MGGLTVILGFFKALSEFFPLVRRVRSWIYGSLGSKWNFRNLQKHAIAAGIESVVNELVGDLLDELPAEWASTAKIEWIETESDVSKEEDQIILRMRPLEDQDANLVNCMFLYCSNAILPKTRAIIPGAARKAAVLQIARRTISEKKPFLTERFEDDVLETAIESTPDIVGYLDKYDAIDKRGFFGGAFLREINEIFFAFRYDFWMVFLL